MKTYYIQTGEYKTKQLANSIDEAATRAIRYIMSEQIPCGLIMTVSKYGYATEFSDKSKDKISTYLIPRVLESLGEYQHAQFLYDTFEKLGYNIKKIKKAFGKDSLITKVRKAIYNNTKEIETLKKDIEKLESQIDEDEGEEWKEEKV